MTYKKDIDGYADGGGESADAASAANTVNNDIANDADVADAVDAANESTLGLMAAPFGK